MQRLEVSGAVRPVYGSLGVKRLIRIIGVLLCHMQYLYLIGLWKRDTHIHNPEFFNFYNLIYISGSFDINITLYKVSLCTFICICF